MPATKRDFANFRDFPGAVGDEGYTYEYPVIAAEDNAGRMREWRIFIQVLRGGEAVPIEPGWFDSRPGPGPGAVAQYWTETGIVAAAAAGGEYKTMKSTPTIVAAGKNIGKKNETSVFTQALILTRSRWCKHMDAAGGGGGAAAGPRRVYPMALHKYADVPRRPELRIVYPCAVQRKLDGSRVVACAAGADVVMYSRHLKTIDPAEHAHIFAELRGLYAAPEMSGVYLDGELYRHGLSLQVINGMVNRREAKKKAAAVAGPPLGFHVFDAFKIAGGAAEPFSARMAMLDAAFAGAAMRFVVRVETIVAADAAAETALYEQFLGEGYEGSVVRNLGGPYEYGTTREKRSYHTRKRKPRHDAEYPVIGFTQGTKGKDVGAIIWILGLRLPRRGDAGAVRRFTATPVGMTYEERYAAYAAAAADPEAFERRHAGKMMTVEFDDLSEDGVPLRAKAKVIREGGD